MTQGRLATEVGIAVRWLREIEGGNPKSSIAAGVAALREGDVLLIAGKGHETGQIVGDRILPFSDQESVRTALGVSAA